jgi:polysaccharide biosynthesis protein PslG
MASDESAPVIQQEFKLLQAAHADSVRFDIFWNAVEWGGKGDYDQRTLGWLDWVFAQARSHGLKVVLDVWSTPCWASSASASLPISCSIGWWSDAARYYPPVNAEDYANFCAFAARRWAPDLAAIELWNEPNGDFLNAVDKAAAYAQLVRAAYPAVKAVAPRLPVLMSLAGTDTTFLAELYANGVRGDYNGIAVHPYGEPTLEGLKQFHAYQLGHGDSTPLWVTEVGWSSSAVGLLGQASDLASVLSQLAALPYVAASEIYEMRDEGINLAVPQDNFGLLGSTFIPKPAWSAFLSALGHPNGEARQRARGSNRCPDLTRRAGRKVPKHPKSGVWPGCQFRTARVRSSRTARVARSACVRCLRRSR